MKQMHGGAINLPQLTCHHCEPVASLSWPLRLVWVLTWRHADNCPLRVEEPCS